MVTIFLVVLNVFAQQSAPFLTNLSERELAVTVANGRTDPWVYRDDSFIGEDRFVWVSRSRNFTEEHTHLTDNLIEEDGQDFLEELDRADEVYALLGEICSPRSFRYHMQILRDQMFDHAIQECASKRISNHIPGQVAVRNSSGLGEPKVQCSSLESGLVTCIALYECVTDSETIPEDALVEQEPLIEIRTNSTVETGLTTNEETYVDTSVPNQRTTYTITQAQTTTVTTTETEIETDSVDAWNALVFDPSITRFLQLFDLISETEILLAAYESELANTNGILNAAQAGIVVTVVSDFGWCICGRDDKCYNFIAQLRQGITNNPTYLDYDIESIRFVTTDRMWETNPFCILRVVAADISDTSYDMEELVVAVPISDSTDSFPTEQELIEGVDSRGVNFTLTLPILNLENVNRDQEKLDRIRNYLVEELQAAIEGQVELQSTQENRALSTRADLELFRGEFDRLFVGILERISQHTEDHFIPSDLVRFLRQARNETVQAVDIIP